MELPPPGTALGRVEDLPDPGGRVAEWDGAPLILMRRGEEVRCFLNICPHAGRALSLPDGRVFVHKGQDVICPVHGATFNVLSGECTGGPAGAPLTAIDITIQNGEVCAA